MEIRTDNSKRNEPKVYIIVLNYKNYRDTIECLESLLKLNYENYCIIVVDNDSRNESELELRKWSSQHNARQIMFIETGLNSGYAGGNNVGIKAALKDPEVDYVWVLNNDTIIDQNALKELVNKAESDDKIGICGSKLMYAWNPQQVQALGGTYNPWLAQVGAIRNECDLDQLDYVVGASMFFRAKMLKEIGLFCEEYFLYFEELDFAERIKGKYTQACAVKSIVYHKEGQSTNISCKKSNDSSMLSDYYALKNRILFTRKYHPLFLLNAYLSLLVAILNRFRRKQYSRIPMILKIIFGIDDNRFNISGRKTKSKGMIS